LSEVREQPPRVPKLATRLLIMDRSAACLDQGLEQRTHRRSLIDEDADVPLGLGEHKRPRQGLDRRGSFIRCLKGHRLEY
jgi:hypothetical protein